MEETAPRPRVRNRRGEGGRLRGEIVAAAVELLDETGEESAVTLRSVARRAGIAAPSIYRHFPDQPAIMLAVVRNAFTELDEQLRAAHDSAVDSPRDRLLAVCHGYLEFARTRPGRYRAMFAGVWIPDLTRASITEQDMATLGQDTLALLTRAVENCVASGCATSTDVRADTVALWLGLHGLAHQRMVSPSFPWPPDIAERVITTLAHLTES